MRFRRVTGKEPAARHPADQLRYCRRARRLRWTHAGDPNRLYEALVDLARQADTHQLLDPDAPQPARRREGRDDTAGSQARARSGEVHWSAEITAPTQAGLILSPAGRALAQRIDGQMHDPALMPYATRRNLLATAAALGIEPFEANLIIALHQHRSTRRDAAALDARRDRRPLPALVICVALEVAAVIGWYLLS